jgi:hypothetical protein
MIGDEGREPPSSGTGEGCPLLAAVARTSAATEEEEPPPPPPADAPELEPTRLRQDERCRTLGLPPLAADGSVSSSRGPAAGTDEVVMAGKSAGDDPTTFLPPFSHVGLNGAVAPPAPALVIPTPYALNALIPLVTIRGTAGVRCGFRIGTAWTDEVDRVELARETPVAVVYEVEAESIEVREREEAEGPGPDKVE